MRFLGALATAAGSTAVSMQLAGLGSIPALPARLVLRPRPGGSTASTQTEGGSAGAGAAGDYVYAPGSALSVPGRGLLAVCQYAPTAAALYNAGATNLQAVDAVNLSVAFVAPASGTVVVQFSAGYNTQGGTGGNALWGLLDHYSGAQVGSAAALQYASNTIGRAVSIAVGGLTPGQIYQWDWAYGQSSGFNASGSNWNVQVGIGRGSPYGPAVMEVHAL